MKCNADGGRIRSIGGAEDAQAMAVGIDRDEGAAEHHVGRRLDDRHAASTPRAMQRLDGGAAGDRDGDLAALSFRAKDALNQATAYLKGRTLQENERVLILVEARATRTEGGALIFGAVTAEAKHGV